MECTRCFEIKELVRGRWCKECKNKYEVERRKKIEKVLTRKNVQDITKPRTKYQMCL